MAYGDFVTDALGVTRPNVPQVPGAKGVGQNYLQMINAFAQGQPTMLQTELTYKPQYTAAELQQISSSLPQVSGMQGSAMTSAGDMVRGINPGQTALLDSLTQQARQGLNLGAALDPSMAQLWTQNVRGGQAARGLGYGPADVLQESTALAGLGQQMREQRQAFGLGTAAANSNYMTNPILSQGNMAYGSTAGLTGASGPTLISGAQNYDVFNSLFNAVAGKNIAGANMRVAEGQSY